jgi:ribosomal protein S27E
MPVLTYPGGKVHCGQCGNEEIIKFAPVAVKSPKDPMAGINIKCTACGTVYDMSKEENQKK